MAKSRTTKRIVDLVSSHEDDEEEWSGLMCADELQDPPISSMLSGTSERGWSPTNSTYNNEEGGNDNLPPHKLPLHLKPGENLVYYEEFIPETDRNEY